MQMGWGSGVGGQYGSLKGAAMQVRPKTQQMRQTDERTDRQT